MALTDGLDRTALLRGAGVAAGVGIVGMVGGGLASSLTGLFVLVIFGGMVAGGYVAGRDQPAVALTAGGLAALLAAVVLQLANLVLVAARGNFGFDRVVTAVFLVMVLTSLGLGGGYLAFRRQAREADPI